MRRLLPLLSALVVLGALASSASAASITWNVTYDDVVNNTNVGFDDPVLGATRRGTVAAVTNYLNTVLNESGTVDLTINNSQLDGTGFLASAGPFFFTSPAGFYNGFVFDHATTGVDPTPAVDDATATFDFGYNWNSDLGAPTGTEFDLFTVALHEVTHALGFLSLVNENGRGLNGANPDVFSVYDSFLERGDGTALFGPGGTYLGNAADLVSGDVFFDGPAASFLNGGPVPVFAPNPFQGGSSISHITTAGAVMNFSIGTGISKRQYLDIERGILQDIGWTLENSIRVVPAPSALLLVAFGPIALLLVRRGRRKES